MKRFGAGNIKVTELHYHRNGICGVGFAVARFTFRFPGEGKDYQEAIATIFNGDTEETKFTGHCAVIVLNRNTGRPCLDYCMRGDHFERDLRWFIDSDEGKRMMFPHLSEVA